MEEKNEPLLGEIPCSKSSDVNGQKYGAPILKQTCTYSKSVTRAYSWPLHAGESWKT